MSKMKFKNRNRQSYKVRLLRRCPFASLRASAHPRNDNRPLTLLSLRGAKRRSNLYCPLPIAHCLLAIWLFGCLAIFTIEAKSEPQSADSHLQLGDSYLKQGKWVKAMNEYQAAIELEPKLASAHAGLGYVHYKLGGYNKSAEHYTEAIKLDPNLAPAYIGLGRAYMSLVNFETAILHFNSAINLDPNAYEAYANRGICYSRQGDYNMAMGDIKKALELNPDYETAYYELGFLYQQQGKYQEAIEAYKKALKSSPREPSTHHNLARCYGRLGMVEAAKKEKELAKKLQEYADEITQAMKNIGNFSDHPQAYEDLAAIHLKYGEIDEAMEAYKLALEVDAGYLPAYKALADIHIKRGNLSAAVDLYQKAVKTKPDSVVARTTLGLLYRQMGRIGDFNKQLQIALKLAKATAELNKTADHFDNLAFVYFISGRYDEAEAAMKKALELEPKNEKYLEQLRQIRNAKRR